MTLHYSYKYNYNCNCNYTTLHYTTLELQLQLRYTNCITLHYCTYTTPQLQLQLRYTTLRDHCNHCNHAKKHTPNHLWVHQRIRSAIRDSQQPTSPIGFLFWKLPPPPCAALLVYTHMIHAV